SLQTRRPSSSTFRSGCPTGCSCQTFRDSCDVTRHDHQARDRVLYLNRHRCSHGMEIDLVRARSCFDVGRSRQREAKETGNETCVFAVALSTFAGATCIEGVAFGAAQSKPATAIKKKKGEPCPPDTNDCNPAAWCCAKPSICTRNGCSQR